MTMKGEKPSDAAIIAAIQGWGSQSMTYVIANRLRSIGWRAIRTDWVLRQLKRLEREGQVVRVPSPYAVQLCWSVLP